MTGFGRAEVDLRTGARLMVEVRALNQRFFELKTNLPRGWAEYESEVRKIVQRFVVRGRIELTVRRQYLKPAPMRVVINEQLARDYVNGLKRLTKAFDLDGKLKVEAILSRPEIFQIIEDGYDYEAEINAGRRVMLKALRFLDRERTREGKSLERDLRLRVAHLRKLVDEVERFARASREATIKTLRDKIRDLTRGLKIDEQKILEEAIAIASRADISEELVRLRTHLQGLRQLLGRRSPVGREIEFLLQELLREVNTVGSKVQNARVAQLVVSAKGELEKMREQVQNVE